MLKNISLAWLFLELILFKPGMAQDGLLQSGPMVGYSTMKEVMLWVQTKEEATVHFEYFAQEKSMAKQKSQAIRTKKEDAFVAKVVLEVEPGKKYTYDLFINDKKINLSYDLSFQSQTLWQWRSDPPNFSFAFGSCNYVNDAPLDRPGKPYGGEHFIFANILKKKPDFMVWAGDNTYLREADWNSRTGILYRHTHTRSLKELQPLLGSVHHYAVWDDHDYGPNNSDKSYWNKDITREAFKLFWGNPNYGLGGGISGTFFWQDVQFFMLDNRYFRSPNNSLETNKELLGKRQMDWLIDALISSSAPFKFIVIGTQVINPFQASWTENYDKFPEEKARLMKAIADNNISGVFFLSGDRHHTELSKIDRPDTYPLYELTVSPLTAGAAGERGEEEANTRRVADTYFGKRNFAVLSVEGERRNRQLNITIFDNQGEEVWKKSFQAQELRKK